MASYLEVKQILKEILCIDMDIDETCDITIPGSLYSLGEENIVLSNNNLKTAFDNMQNFTKNQLEISTNTCREVAVQFFNIRGAFESEPINDSTNGLIYSLGPASNEYCTFLLNNLAESVKSNGRRLLVDLKHRSRMALRRNSIYLETGNSMDLLPDLLRAYTLKISSTQSLPV